MNMGRWWAGFTARVHALFDRASFESDLDEELQFHLQQSTARNIRRGMTVADAERAALAAMGRRRGVTRTKEDVRGETGVSFLLELTRDVKLDVRFALRDMTRRKTFAFVVIFTVAVCIAVNAVMFSIVHSVLLNPLPFSDSGRLVRIHNSYPDAGILRSGNSVPDYYDRREHVASLQNLALYTEDSRTIERDGWEQRVPTMAVTPSFFSVLNVNLLLGGGFNQEIDATEETFAAILGYDLWQSAFGGSDDVVGASVRIEGGSYTVVGVLPGSFQFSSWDAQLYTTFSFSAKQRSDNARHSDWYPMIGRLRNDSTIETVQAELDRLNEARVSEYAAPLQHEVTTAGYRTEVRPYLADLTRNVRQPLLFLWLSVLLVLIIGGANVMCLFLVRARSRRTETACRMALGASRFRVTRQFMTESMLITMIGGVCGLLIAIWSMDLLDVLSVYGLPRMHEVAVNPLVVTCTMLTAIALGAAGGLLGGRSVLASPGGHALQLRTMTTSRGSSRLHRILTSGQIALAYVLVIDAGFLVASMQRLNAIDPGFRANRIVCADLALPNSRYSDEEARPPMTRQILDSLRSVPGIESVAAANRLPFPGGSPRISVVAASPTDNAAELFGPPRQNVVSPDYFDALSIAMLDGRGFDGNDTLAVQRVAIVDQTLARRLWPHGDPIGQQLWRGKSGKSRDPSRAVTIIGVVESIRQGELVEADPAGAFYVPLDQVPLRTFSLALKVEQGMESNWTAIRARIAALDSDIIVSSTTTLADSIADSLVLQRTPMRLLSLFASIGLLLGVLGVYGVMSCSVGNRIREIGLRMAIGSTPGQIGTLMGREWLMTVAIGLGVGLVGALATFQIIADMLYEIGVLDPRVIVSAASAILLAAFLACVVPIWRAMSVDPASVLRGD